MAIGIDNTYLAQQVQTQADDLEKRVEQRTQELRGMVNAMAGREIRMAELKQAIKQLRKQLIRAGLTPVADDPLIPSDDGG